jgi:hypothetical protein
MSTPKKDSFYWKINLLATPQHSCRSSMGSQDLKDAMFSKPLN